MAQDVGPQGRSETTPMNIIWSPTARADLEQIESYISERNPPSAAKMTTTILRAIEDLRHFPAIGRVGRVPGTRELVIAGTPYIVPYRVVERGLEIIAVMHGRRRWPDAAGAQRAHGGRQDAEHRHPVRGDLRHR